jgi:arsenate reductase
MIPGGAPTVQGKHSRPAVRIAFLCTANSARSQMAEGLARAILPEDFEDASAGTFAWRVHPVAIEVMAERGIDIGGQRSKSVDELDGEFDYVITLCDSAAAACPNLQGKRARLHWPFPDPVAAETETEADAFRQVRDGLEEQIRNWARETFPEEEIH